MNNNGTTTTLSQVHYEKYDQNDDLIDNAVPITGGDKHFPCSEGDGCPVVEAFQGP